MRFIHAWSYSCANYLSLQLKENHEKKRIYYYGFQVLIGGIVKSVFLVSVSLLLGALVPALVVVFAFSSLRVVAGGYHMNTYGKCLATSMMLFIIAAVIAQYTYKFWQTEYIIVLVILCFIIVLSAVLKWAPSDNPNRPIKKPEEIRKFKNLSILHNLLFMGAIFLLIYYKIDKYQIYVIAASFGLLFEAFTITPAGISFFSRLEGSADHISR